MSEVGQDRRDEKRRDRNHDVFGEADELGKPGEGS
jgi:hypothetical protein